MKKKPDEGSLRDNVLRKNLMPLSRPATQPVRTTELDCLTHSLLAMTPHRQ